MNAPFADPFNSSSTTDYNKVLDLVRAMKPDTLPSEQHDSVVTLIEYLQQQVLIQVDKLHKEREDLRQRELVLKAEKKRTQAAMKAATAVMASSKVAGVFAKLLGR